MKELVNIKDFDRYVYDVLNEDLIHGEQKACNRAFINSGPITMSDGKVVHPKEIVKVVEESLMYLNSEFSRTFEFANNTMNIIYLAHSNKIKTMAIDAHMNLYLNASFVYGSLKMDSKLVAAVLMHEALHGLFNHIERGNNWLAAKGKNKTPQTLHDNNLAADIEVNQTLVKIDIINENRLINEIKGLYLKNISGDLGTNTNVVPMEVILENEDFMAKLRSMCPPPQDPEGGMQESVIETTDDWNQGYKDAWNKIAGLVKKYGAKGTWDKMLEAGLVNGVGEIYTDHNIEDIKALEFMQVKSMDEFIEESLKQNNDDKGKTYDDGFITAFSKLVSSIYDSLQPSDDEGVDGEGGQGGGEKYKSDLKNEDLDEIDLPGKKKGKSKGDEDDGLPNNINQSGSSDDNDSRDNKESESNGEGDSKKKPGESSKSSGKGGQGKSDDELSDDDFSQLADDLRNKMEKGGKTSTKQDISIGGTGSFMEDGLSDEDLKEAGYSDDDIKSINDVRKENERNNSKEKMEKVREEVKRRVNKSSAVGRYLDAIEVESNKYKNVWKTILKEFMAKNTRRAGTEKPNGDNDWVRKKSIARGEYGIHRQKTAQDPQDLNVYVDVSGSVDMDLLQVICQSLVVFTQQFKYSGINICPWASVSNGVYKVENFGRRSKEEVTSEILEIVSKGISQCGGGTDVDAALDAMQEVVVQTLNDPRKKRKDDVHVIITDGYFYYNNVENNIRNAVMSAIDRPDVAEKAPKHTFWMIYDMDEHSRGGWIKEIKEGTLIFINSEVVKNNG